MLKVVNLSKSFGDQTLFSGISFSLSPGERIGLVGRNGSGKSTLFKIILGEEAAHEGEVVVPRGYRCGHLAQHLRFTEPTIVREACLGLPEDEREEEYRAEIILAGLGFSEADMQRPPESFSGGFQIRINLAKVLLSEPNLLLLDEPTNYLDIVSARWLSRFLRSWKNELLIITHDRDFMDSVTTHTMLIHRQKIRKIPGGTEKLYSQIAQDEEIHERTRQNEDKKRRDMQVVIDRFRAKASKAAMVQSKIKALERMGVKEELRDESTLDFEFRESPFHGRFLLEARDLSFSYESAQPPLIQNISLALRPGERICVIGKNGKGKSTLLRLLAQELTPQQGEVSLNANSKVGYFGQTNINRLDPTLTVESEIWRSNSSLSRTSVRSICGTMMFDGDKALKKISVLSGGERSRVLLGKLLAQPSNLLFLDEPSNHLDMESVDALIESLQQYAGAVVLVTHSELILRQLATKLVVFQDHGPEIFDGDYDYFLQKVGWVDEEADRPSRSNSKQARVADARSDAPEPDKRERAKQRQERAKVLGPLEREMQTIEKEISNLEQQVATANEELLSAAQESNGARLAELGKSVKEAQKLIEQRFQALEQLMEKHQKLEEQFSQ